jgi:hypothetical protein
MVDAIRGYGLGPRGPARGAAPREGFRLPRAAGPAPAAGVGGIAAAAVAPQDHGITDAERNDAAARRGGALLAEMAALQGGLLMGHMPDAALRRLAHLAQGEGGADPALREVLDAISLRARVELARMGR